MEGVFEKTLGQLLFQQQLQWLERPGGRTQRSKEGWGVGVGSVWGVGGGGGDAGRLTGSSVHYYTCERRFEPIW